MADKVDLDEIVEGIIEIAEQSIVRDYPDYIDDDANAQIKQYLIEKLELS